MFTNPLNRKYQTGGSTPTDDQKKDMQGFVTWIKSNVEGFKDKSEQEIARSLSDMAKSDEGKKSVQDLYSRYQKSKKSKSKFADGGKFQDFICKHGRGGNVNCGCGGMKVVRGQEGFQTPDNNPYAGWTVNPRQWVTNPDGSTEAIQIIVSPDGKTGIQRRIIDRSRVKNRGTVAVRDTLYGGGAHDNGKVYIDASQNLLPQEKEAVNAILDGKVQSKQQGGKNLWDTINGWFDNSDTEKRDADFTTNAKNAFAKGRIIEVLPNGWRREIDREWPFMGAQPENIDTVLYTPNGKRIYSPTAIEMLEKIKNPKSSEDSVEKEQDGGDLSRRQVRADTRQVRRLMGNKNGYTAGERYRSILNATKNYDQFAGMSRLERKNAINQIILGNTTSGYTEPSSITDVEPNEAPDYVRNRKYNIGSSNPDVRFVQMLPFPTKEQFNKATANRRIVNRPIQNITLPDLGPIEIEESPIVTPSYGKIKDSNFDYIKPMNVPGEHVWAPGEFDKIWLESRLNNAQPEELDRLSYTPVNVNLMRQNFGRYPITGPTWGKGDIVNVAPTLEEAQRNNGGPLSPYQMELLRVLTENPNATINDVRGNWTPETFEAAKRRLGFKQGGQIEKHQNDNGIIDHYRSKWANDWNNIKRGWNNFKDSAFGLIVPTSGEELLMSAVPMGKPIYTGAKAAKAASKVKITPKVGQGITETAGGPLLEFEGDLIKIRSGLTPVQREKARKLAYEIADARALRKSLPRDLDDAYGMTNGPWSSTFGRHFKLSELNK